jgi:hypothetical protein
LEDRLNVIGQVVSRCDEVTALSSGSPIQKLIAGFSSGFFDTDTQALANCRYVGRANKQRNVKGCSEALTMLDIVAGVVSLRVVQVGKHDFDAEADKQVG